MLPKSYCLIKEKDFMRVAKRGQSFFLPGIGVKFIENNFKNSRFGIIVSKKIDKRAVVRNRLKRQIREIIFQNLDSLKPGFDILILTQVGVKNFNFWQLKEKLEIILTKLKLLIKQ